MSGEPQTAGQHITTDEYVALCRRGHQLTVRVAEYVQLGQQLHSDIADYTACVEMAGWLSLIRPDEPSAQVPAAPGCAKLGEPELVIDDLQGRLTITFS